MTDLTRYLCFSLGSEEFAMPLLKVKEVIGVPDTTPIPQSPSYFVGIMNLRGSVISILDMRLKLGIKPKNGEETTVIILDIGETKLGIIVDCVNSVVPIQSSEVSPRPTLESSKAADYIVGVFRKQEHLVLMLDVEKALSIEDKSHLIKNSVPKVA